MLDTESIKSSHCVHTLSYLNSHRQTSPLKDFITFISGAQFTKPSSAMSTPTLTTMPSIQEMDDILHQRLVLGNKGILAANTNTPSTQDQFIPQENARKQQAGSSQGKPKQPRLKLQIRHWKSAVAQEPPKESQKRKSGVDSHGTLSPPPPKRRQTLKLRLSQSSSESDEATPSQRKQRDGIQPTPSAAPIPIGKRREDLQPAAPSGKAKPKFGTLTFQPVYDTLCLPPPPDRYPSPSPLPTPSAAPAHSTRGARAQATTSSYWIDPRRTFTPYSDPDVIQLTDEHPASAWARLFPDTVFPEHGSGKNYREDMGWKEKYGGWYRRKDYPEDVYVPNVYKPTREERVYAQGVRYRESNVRAEPIAV